MQELNYIRGARNLIGLSQDEMANELGIARMTYANKEAKPETFTKAELKAIVMILKEHGLPDETINIFLKQFAI